MPKIDSSSLLALRYSSLMFLVSQGINQAWGAIGEPATMAVQFGVGEMFMQSHIVVKAVIVFLSLCSLLTWALFIEKTWAFVQVRRTNLQFLASFRQQSARGDMPDSSDGSAMGRMWGAARSEIEIFREQHAKQPSSHQANRLLQRAALTAGIVQEQELSRLGTMMGVLATIGSTSPFVGLFGTVWGILNSFAQIAVSKSTSLSVVAPGIAEALLATAIGLFAAIPAVMIYNKFVRDINGFVGALDNFSAEMVANLSRQLDVAE
ncbi:MAG: MotA/TolQ/ExbB proton channel family protein [Rhodocyclaceae bacterium]|nr:MotA/TolQ/ExbB proton channel family protein [Rhodocyclaceae bacterium]